MPQGDDVKPQALIASIGKFKGRNSPRTLKGSKKGATRLTEVLRHAQFGFEVHAPSSPSANEVRTLLGKAQRPGSAPTLVHILTHGEKRTSTLWVAGSTASNDVSPEHWVNLREWLELEQAKSADHPPLLVVLDVCHAGVAAKYKFLLQPIASRKRPMLVLGACRDERAFNCRLTNALCAALNRLAEGQIDSAEEYISSTLLVTEIYQQLKLIIGTDQAPAQVMTASASEAGLPIPIRMFRNPRYLRDPLQRVEANVRDVADAVMGADHFLTRAAGTDRPDVCLFHGRRKHLETLSVWIDQPDAQDPLLVVNGGPGTGKSALIGAIACLAHPDLEPIAHAVERRIGGVQSPHRRHQGSIAVLHARNRTLAELIGSAARQLGVATACSTIGSLLDSLDTDTPQRVLVIDAVDEAVNSAAVYQSLIRPIIEDPLRRCRILVGIRTLPEEQPPVLQRAKVNINLDDGDPCELTQNVEDYIYDIQRLKRPNRTIESIGRWRRFANKCADELISRPAEDLSERVGPYLLAQLYCHQLHKTDPDLILDDPAGYAARAPRTIAEALRLDLASPGNEWIAAQLEAVAYAFGDGMPRSLIEVAAKALRPGLEPPTDTTLDIAFTAAGFYLRRSIDTDGSVLYRLFHQSLIDDLQQTPFSRERTI